ncbi:MAG: DUF3515 family protein [Kineosporiaceae bacterium]
MAHRTGRLYGGTARGAGAPVGSLPGAFGAVLLTGLLTGCAGTVQVEPAGEGASTACRDVVDRLPGSLSDQPRRGAEGAGVAAWGDPAIVLRCGTEPLGPTTRECVTVDGMDWVVLAQGEDGAAVFATYGRVPGVEVEVPGAYAPAPGVLPGLGPAVSELPVERSCL